MREEVSKVGREVREEEKRGNKKRWRKGSEGGRKRKRWEG